MADSPDIVATGTVTVPEIDAESAPSANGWHDPEPHLPEDVARTAGFESAPGGHGPGDLVLERPANDPGAGSGCTAAQLRRFIKSRPWVPMHELRRRFGINGAEDDVAPLEVDGRRVFVGLPPREAGLMAELVRGGDVGVELSLDPGCPMVIGVYPMRPISRG